MNQVLSGCAVRAAIQQEARSDSDMLDMIEEHCLTLRAKVTKCGKDDTNIRWEVIQHGFDGITTLLATEDGPRAALDRAREVLAR
jgi:hypothetical protein